MKKLIKNRGEGVTYKGCGSNYFISVFSEKYVFITIGMLTVINRSILSSGLLSTRK